MSLIDLLKTKVIISEIKKQDWEKLGIDAADSIDQMLDNSCGDNRSSDIQSILIPATNKFYLAFTKRLNEHSQKGHDHQK